MEAYNAEGTSAAITGSLTLTAGPTAYYLINVWKGTYPYDNGSQQVAYGAASTASAYQWTLEAVSGSNALRLKTRVRTTTPTSRANLPSTYTIGQWVLQSYAGTTRILSNRPTCSTYFNAVRQTGFAQHGAIAADHTSSQWSFQPVSGSSHILATASPASLAPALGIFPNPAG